MGLHHSTIGIWWGFLIKYWIPTILTVVLLSEFREKSYNPYGGYPWGYLVVGILWFAGMVIIVAVVVIWPQWMTQKADDAKFESVPLDDVGPSEASNATPKVVITDQSAPAETEKFID